MFTPGTCELVTYVCNEAQQKKRDDRKKKKKHDITKCYFVQ
jgi:hypothetical protein